MQPFLLAFVDTPAFEFIMWLLLIGAVLGAIAALVVFFLGARFALQSGRQLRAAETWPQRFRAVTPLLVLTFVVGSWLLYSRIATHYQARRLAEQRVIAQQRVDSLRSAVIGTYRLADSTHTTRLAATSRRGLAQPSGHTVADTAVVAAEAVLPFVELVVRADSTFHYTSNIVGDATGATQQGRWKVECSFCYGTPDGFTTRINFYEPNFYTINPYSGRYETSNTLVSFYEKRDLRFMGSCKQRGTSAWLQLKKVSSEAASAAL
ncbi:hypothetical protein [Hymenobacter cellulosilyticus]|uniref:Uncharacterized protein n=1 Tax=Hymenobacter cellulosilyticus TaxID=2932248 RepID=A0A8T9Q7M7_9BACT|nr:hypothetical protein [Hymenobacter cellulosilyticus]UOQ73586.1 hypothetical protein MUN79_06565 [Hymenobacter cellulosilyticus]